MNDPDHIEDNFRDYLNGYSENVQNILEKFKFDGPITTMENKGILYIVLKEFTTDRGNMHPNEISNLERGYIFEEIIRRFSESHNEDAGQHYTPREVIQLMVNILFNDDKKLCLKRVILEASGTLVKPQNSRSGLEYARKVSKSWSVGIEKIRWIIKAHRKACKGYLRVLPVDA